MFIVTGTVLRNKQRGRELGYPTANVRLNTEIPQGIYISETLFENKKMQSVTFIGNAKTFSENDIFAETYILDFDEDIYNVEITVRLIKKIRENQKFESVEKLVEQIKKDVEETRKFFE